MAGRQKEALSEGSSPGHKETRLSRASGHSSIRSEIISRKQFYA
jgi:hypothetical protein